MANKQRKYKEFTATVYSDGSASYELTEPDISAVEDSEVIYRLNTYQLISDINNTISEMNKTIEES